MTSSCYGMDLDRHVLYGTKRRSLFGVIGSSESAHTHTPHTNNHILWLKNTFLDLTDRLITQASFACIVNAGGCQSCGYFDVKIRQFLAQSKCKKVAVKTPPGGTERWSGGRAARSGGPAASRRWLLPQLLCGASGRLSEPVPVQDSSALLRVLIAIKLRSRFYNITNICDSSAARGAGAHYRTRQLAQVKLSVRRFLRFRG